MKKLLLLTFVMCCSINIFGQSLSDLSNNPTFKGITIGDPISKHSHMLSYRGASKGKKSYDITDRSFYSIFNVKMDEAIVIEYNGKVYGILLGKDYAPGLFDPNELQVLRTSLSDRYGSPNISLDDFSGTPSVAGDRWETRNVELDIAYLFYGTLHGSKLRYMLYERHDDY